MFSEILERLSAWSELNTAIAVTAALAAMSCALPGAWLVLRRQSMLGDALAHSALPGVVAAFMVAYGLRNSGWVSDDAFDPLLQACIVIGAALAGLLTAWLTAAIQRLGKVDNGAALGVVFTCLFAAGMVMVRMTADDVHLDPDCALFGVLEASAGDTLQAIPWLPRSAVANGAVLIINLLLTMVFFKELRIAAFDAELSNTLGIPAAFIQYALLAATAVAAATAFSTVGSILVIGLLVIPAATAQLLTTRLWKLIALSVVLAAAMAVIGHAAAWAIPGPLFSRLGYPQVRDVGTSGMIAVVGGLIFVATVFIAPRTGIVTQVLDRIRVLTQIAADDVLGNLYRKEESARTAVPWTPVGISSAWQDRLAGWWLKRRGFVIAQSGGTLALTDRGRETARSLIRSHRLWESYLDQNYPLSDEQLHRAADRVEHYIGSDIRDAIASELPDAHRDPHGRQIPDT
ncbi:Manganese transport system membrane protein MntB [Caulifigura coniformis]|uniref:Manganese transport system membrane protein MntB n=1 Tax=Caulifigura coniformis TaxID=2527983 RepID=A0A517SAU8_9PLAN|nr:metal ABC transporter permease [Caulifigura coniformis]QDT53243.1 Manganese transport system membrane protein MntB [Caulifigura coniformis]